MSNDIKHTAGGWSLSILGNLAIWLGDHALALVGVASIVFGMWVQYQLLVLRRIEVTCRCGRRDSIDPSPLHEEPMPPES